MTVTREELHALVWSKPMTHAARQFDVSGSYLARICTLLNVPRPQRGYWAQLVVGKAPAVVPLPTANPGDPIEWCKESMLELPPPSQPQPAAPAAPKRRPRPTSDAQPRPATHGLIAGARKHFENSRASDDSEYLRPYKKLLVDITTSHAALTRALETANAIFNAMESKGIRVVVAHQGEHLRRSEIEERERESRRPKRSYPTPWAPHRPTVAYVRDVAVGLALVEMSEEREMRYVNGKYVPASDYKPPKQPRHFVDTSWTTTMEKPTGRLRLVAYSPYQLVSWGQSWQETAKSQLNDQIPSIVRAMDGIAADLHSRLVVAREEYNRKYREYLAEEERRRRAEDRARIAAARKESLQQLGDLIRAWSKANATEHFFSDLQLKAECLPEGTRASVIQRIDLARSLVGERDALEAFGAWLAPDQRYESRYPEDDLAEEDATASNG